jgi:hypothetical protein
MVTWTFSPLATGASVVTVEGSEVMAGATGLETSAVGVPQAAITIEPINTMLNNKSSRFILFSPLRF